MRKYWHVINIGIQNTLVYRFNFLARATMGLIPLTAVIFLWRTIYEGKAAASEVAGYTLAQMISYYLVVTLVDMLTAVAEDDWMIAADIKDGNISQFLVKPIDYLTYRLSLFFSGRIIYTAVAMIPVALFIIYMRKYFVLPPDAMAWCGFLVSLVLTGLSQFLLSFTMALLAFWVLEISSFSFILLALERLASGQMFPLDILPHGFAQLLMWTPFPYGVFFPVSIYMGKVTGTALVQGLFIQIMWVAATYALARMVWGRGLKTYTVVGG